MIQESPNEIRDTDKLLLELTMEGYVKKVLKPENINKNIKLIVFLDESDFEKHGIYATPKEVATFFNRSLIAIELPLKAETCTECKKYLTFKLPEGMKPDSSIILRRTKKFNIKNYDFLARKDKLPEAYKNLLRQEYIKNLWANIKFDKKIPPSISPREDRKLIINENIEKISEEKKWKKREEELKFIKEMKGTRGS